MATTPSIITALDLGYAIRALRENSGLTQRELAAAAGVGERFIVELEHGKETCQLGKVLRVLRMLNAGVSVTADNGPR